MNKKRIVLIIFCLLLAAGLTYGQYAYLNSINKPEERVAVLVAKEAIAAGEPVQGKLEPKSIPISAFVPGMITAQGEAPLYAKVDISPGTYVIKDMVSEARTPVIAGENRRVTIGVNITSALAGRIKPGDVVDIGFIPSDQDAGQPEVIAVAVPILEVLNERGEPIASGNKKENQYDTTAKIPAVATLVVDSPEQGVMIKEKEARGRLFFMGY